MSTIISNQSQILDKLGIKQLNPMQKEALETIKEQSDIILLSPTGTGKTVAFLLPLLPELDPKCAEIQLLIVVPTRELALQTEQVVWKMGTGFKANAVYGGRAGAKDKADIKHRPAILIGTPGRLADHLRRESFAVEFIKTIVLDEFDKSLEIGFEADMVEVMAALPNIEKKILTSASQQVKVPEFVGLKRPAKINYLSESVPLLKVKKIQYTSDNKKDALLNSINYLGDELIIIFCNFKDTINELSEFLSYSNVNHGCFHGGMEQPDREHTLIKFRNGTHKILIATDLAARGIDIPEVKYVIHYELPMKEHEFTHRNGRTARMNRAGTAYILEGKEDYLPEYIGDPEIEPITKASKSGAPLRKTIHILGGKRDQISKGDIVGFLIKQGKLESKHLGLIELKQDCSFVGVDAAKADQIVSLLNNTKLKKKKVRVSVL